MKAHRLGVIDGLRGIAILVVLWFHTWQQSWLGFNLKLGGVPFNIQPIAETGFLGVSLFFFISGFVIALPFIEAWAQGRPRPNLTDFYWRRFLKIAPSYWLNIAVCLALGLAAYGTFGAALNDVTVHLLFVQNWWLPSRLSLNGVLWTLAIEVQFYVLAPLLMRVFLRFPLPTFLITVCIANFWRFFSYTKDSLLLDYRMEQLTGNIDLFMIGILAAYTYVLVGQRRPELAAQTWRWTLLAASGAALTLVLVNSCYGARFDDDGGGFTNWQMRYRTALGAAFGMLALGSLFAAQWWKKMLANPFLLFMAAISYNLYLWHDVVLLLSERFRVPHWATLVKTDDRVWQYEYMFGAQIVSIALAAAITYRFERPILRLKALPPRRAFEAIVRGFKKSEAG